MTWPPSLLRFSRLVTAALLLACVPLGCGRSVVAPEEEPHPAPVKAEPIRRATLKQWTAPLPGASQPLVGHAAQISAGVEGRVLAILPDLKGQPVNEGHQVAAGQVIVQLDDRIARANRAKVEEQRKQAEIGVALAKITLDPLEKLRPPGMAEDALPLVSRIDLEKARIALKDAEAKEKAAVADLNAIDQQLTFYTLRAPIAGRLGMVHAMPGQWLPVGTTVADVVSLDEIDVLCFVAPDVAARLQLNQPARLTRDEGKVVFIAVQGQAESGNFAVKVRFPNRDLHRRANAIVSPQVLTQSKKNALSIPAVALSADQDPPGVILVVEEKKEGKTVLKARRLEAVIGIRDRDQDLVELLGLHDAEAKQDVPISDAMRFVVEGGAGLETGDPVELPKDEHEKEK